jgi:hypothetical protein
MSVLNTLSASDSSLSAKKHVSSGPHNHKKVDVGFAAFEQNLTSLVSSDLEKVTSGDSWTPSMKTELMAKVATMLNTSLNDRFKPLKQTIGKTWVALPDYDQKDAYVDQLQFGFNSIFNGAMDTIQSHVERGLSRFSALTKRRHMDSSELMLRCEAGINESLLTEHCYDDPPTKKNANKTHGAVSFLEEAVTAGARVQAAIVEAFCIQSVIAGMVHRLNDTLQLVSMTTRFEARAMGLTQVQKK